MISFRLQNSPAREVHDRPHFPVDGTGTQSSKASHPLTELVGPAGLAARGGGLPEPTGVFSLETARTPGVLGPLLGCRCEDGSGCASAGLTWMTSLVKQSKSFVPRGPGRLEGVPTVPASVAGPHAPAILQLRSKCPSPQVPRTVPKLLQLLLPA